MVNQSCYVDDSTVKSPAAAEQSSLGRRCSIPGCESITQSAGDASYGVMAMDTGTTAS